MVYLLAGCAVLIALLLAARVLVKANPQRLGATLRKVGGVALFMVAGFLALRGALPIAIPLAAFAVALLGGGGLGGLGGVFGSSQKSPGQTSSVGTERLEMELDHDTGHMDGKCLVGRFAGHPLSALSDREAVELYQEFAADGFKEAALMEAYLDWRVADWRDRAEDAEGAASGSHGTGPRRGRMSPEEARAVLEVGANATDEEIRSAHRRLMKKMHPDQGGSTYLAARINEAKEVLLGS
ncbi:MAG: DnaJ domain-containing protein [Alphaproteobacteria bacterium]